MRHIAVDDVPTTAVIVVKLDDGSTAIFESYLSGGELLALIDINDHHRFIVNTSRLLKVVGCR